MVERYIYVAPVSDLAAKFKSSTGLSGLTVDAGWANEIAIDAATKLSVEDKTSLDNFMDSRGFTFSRQETTTFPFNAASKINTTDEQTLSINSETPSVANYALWREANTSSTTITNFLGGVEGQRIYMRWTSSRTTVANNANIMTASRLPVVGSANENISFILQTGVWREV